VYSEKTDNSCNTPKCLINKLPLGINKITLSCNHTFNYTALYKEIYNIKYKYPRTRKLQRNEIRCPYCRKVHQNILPYIPEEVLEKIVGINWPPKYALMPSICKHILKSGNRKGESCLKPCLAGIPLDLCTRHKKMHQAAANKLSIPLCHVLLKSGKRKGELCGAKCKQNNMCLRHYKQTPEGLLNEYSAIVIV
jgi:hypothetical protein